MLLEGRSTVVVRMCRVWLLVLRVAKRMGGECGIDTEMRRNGRGMEGFERGGRGVVRILILGYIFSCAVFQSTKLNLVFSACMQWGRLVH